MTRVRCGWRGAIGAAYLMLMSAAEASDGLLPSDEPALSRPRRLVINDAQMAYLASVPNGFPDSVLGPLALESMPDAKPGLAAQLQRVSLATPFLPVGQLFIGGNTCTATWLGQQEGYTYVLTAAHCLGDRSATVMPKRMRFVGWDGGTLATGDGWGFIHDAQVRSGNGPWPQKASMDIAVAKIPTWTVPMTPDGKLLAQPLIDDGIGGIGDSVDVVGYGVWNDGQSQGRRWGRGRLGKIGRQWISLPFHPLAGSEHAVLGSKGDSGAALWQVQSGYWRIVGTISGVSGKERSLSARVSGHLTWLRQVFPHIRTVSDRLTLTASQAFVSRNFSRTVDRGGVYFTVPPQAVAQGPSVRRSGLERGYSKISVEVINEMTQQRVRMWLRGEQIHGDKENRRMEDASDASASWQLKVSFHVEDNPELPMGQYRGRFEVEGHGTLATSFVDRFPLYVRVHHRPAVVSLHQPFQGPPLGEGKAYYTTSYPMVDMPSRHTHQGPGPQWAWAKVFRKEDGVQHAIRLRVLHDSDFERENFQRGGGCHGYHGGRLTVSFHSVDQGGPALPPGLYQGATQFTAHRPEDGAVLDTIPLKIELDMRRPAH